MKKRIFAVVVMTIVLSVLLAFSVSAETVEPHWINNGDGTWSYMEANGELVKDEPSYWIGEDCYGFDANGIMYTGWVQPHRTDMDHIHDTYYRNLWYYYDASGHAAEGYQVVDGTGYLFYSNGQLSTNDYCWQWDAEAEAQRLYVSDEDGVATEITVTNDWLLVGDTYYYAIEEEGEISLPQGLYEIAGTEYYFHNGRLIEDEWVYFWDENDNHCSVYAQAGGHLIKEGWVYEPNGNIRYIMDGQRLGYGIYEIGEDRYAFDWDGLIQITGWYDNYFLVDGKVAANQWYQFEDGRYMYFNEYGSEYAYGWHTVGDVEYYFSDGYLVTNDFAEKWDPENEVYVYYVLGDGGYPEPAAEGWNLVGDRRIYLEDGEIVYSGLRVIDGTEYAFDERYLINDEGYYWLYDEKIGRSGYYHVYDNGTVNKTPGWVLLDGRWLFVEPSGMLREGWLYDGGVWYYMRPTMYKNTTVNDSGRSYYFDSNGKSTDVTANGFYRVSASTTYYFEYGQPAYGWRQLGGNWYFFGSDMYADGAYEIGSDYYYFNNDGVMLTGWFKDSENCWRYADENGHLAVDGKHEIDGVTYFFNYEGQMVTNRYWWDDDGVSYLLDENGAVIMNSTEEPGWKEHNGKWYYMNEDGYYYRNGWYYIGEQCYYFDRNFTMVEDQIVDGHYYAKGGACVEEGWILHEGKWYYAYPDGGGQLHYDGPMFIDDNKEDDIPGKYYVFRNYEMQVGSFVYGADIVVTDASGAVVALQPFDEGWNLVNEYGNGVYYYVENGELYHGWKGDYYLAPQMLAYTTQEIDGKYYFFDANGVYARNGWVNAGYTWFYAKEDGSLVCNDWLYLDGVYYYFQDVSMVEDGEFWVGDKLHAFAKGGAWIGEVKDEEPEYADGWHLIDGVWQYVQNGYFLENTIRKIDGVWYGFDYEGMAKNGFNGYGYYMNNSGIVQNYVGWKMIDGKWYYFSVENRAAYGWFNVGDAQYYGTEEGIAIGYKVIGNVLYYFDEGGVNTGKVTADGWYQSGSAWYYVRDGKAVRDEMATIDGVDYYFGYDGEMVENALVISDDRYGISFALMGAGGGRVTTEGWYMLNGEWLYVDANGYLCNGTHNIGDTIYNFNLIMMYINWYMV